MGLSLHRLAWLYEELTSDPGGPARRELIRGHIEREWYRVAKQLLLASPAYSPWILVAVQVIFAWTSWRETQALRRVEVAMGHVKRVIEWRNWEK